MARLISKESVLLLLVLLVGLLLSQSMIGRLSSGTFSVKLYRHDGGIATIDATRPAKPTQTFRVDRLRFPEGKELKLYSGTRFGYTQNFSLLADTRLDVLHAGEFIFKISSDDGFRLSIDGRKLCEFPKDRPFAETICQTRLTKGEHLLHLEYFQGLGPLGLVGRYRHLGEKQDHYLGENSKFLAFRRLND